MANTPHPANAPAQQPNQPAGTHRSPGPAGTDAPFTSYPGGPSSDPAAALANARSLPTSQGYA